MKPSRDPQVKGVEYWKHARPFNKRRFWKAVRRGIRRALRRGDE